MTDKISIYTDEHIPMAVIKGLRRRGVDVLTTQETGMLGAADEEQLALATNQGRVVLTQDEDFMRLHARKVNHSGIIYARQQTPIGDLIRGVMLIYQVLDASEMHNHVEFL